MRTITSFLLGLALQPVQAQNIVVSEVSRTGGSPSVPFGTIGGMLEVAPGVALISDDVNKAIWRWDASAGRVTRFARDGRGPGEVTTPSALGARPSGGFALYDAGLASVLFFDSARVFDHTVRLQGGMVSNAKSLAVLAHGSFVVSGGRLRDPRHLHRYSAAGEWLESYGDPSPAIESSNAKIQSAGGALRPLGRGFLFSYGAPLRVLRFPNNNLQSPTQLIEDAQILPALTEESLHGPARTVQPGLGLRPFLWWHDRSTGLFVFPDGRLLNVITRYHRGDSVWDLYAPDGRRLARTVLPRAWYAWDMTTTGHVLASYRRPDTDEHIAALLKVEMR